MKKLSRSEMKKVMGGNPPQTAGCYALCGLCLPGDDGPGCGGFMGWIPINSCEGAGHASCAGMYLHNCQCVGAPGEG